MMAIPAPTIPDKAIIAPAVRDATNTPASMRIPLRGELNKGTSDMPLNSMYKKSNAGLPVEKVAGPSIR